MIRKVDLLPAEVFATILESAVIPTFDLLIEYGDQGFIFVKRKIAPYKDVWALPGLRMMKSEEIDDVLERIAFAELGLKIKCENKILLGQYVGKFTTEHHRQDLSTGYFIKVSSDQKVAPNPQHFSGMKISYDVPKPIGAMYQYYFDQLQKRRSTS